MVLASYQPLCLVLAHKHSWLVHQQTTATALLRLLQSVLKVMHCVGRLLVERCQLPQAATNLTPTPPHTHTLQAVSAQELSLHLTSAEK
jgi:hypothetical protein